MNGRPQALLLDVEGVLVDYRVALAGALNTVREARRRGLAIRLVTNTATRHHEQLLQELLTLGFAVVAEELFTAPLAAQSWLQRRELRPLALVHPAIAPLFQGLGGEEGAEQSGGRPNCVLLGDARDQLSSANLNRALELLLEGAPLIDIGRNRRFRSAATGCWMPGRFCRRWSTGPAVKPPCWANPLRHSLLRWCSRWGCPQTAA